MSNEPASVDAGLCAFDASTLARKIAARELSCHEVMQAYLARIDRLNPKVNAIVSLQDADGLLAQARSRDDDLARGEHRGWLHGMPIAVKDLAPTAGIRTTMGSPIFAENVPTQDGLMVARMKRAGAIVIGKTNVPEFGLGSQTYNQVFGATRNAYDTSLCAGGSSGGAAVALALRMVPVADGGDMMGSLRNPAAFNNVYGFRPSQGRVPFAPATDSFVSQLGTEGPMGRTVQDMARLLAIQAGYDSSDPLSLDGDGRIFDGPLDLATQGLRIGWLGDLDGYLPMEAGVLALCEAACNRLESIGCRVEPGSLGFPPERLWSSWLVWRRLLQGGKLAAHYHDEAKRALLKPEAIWEVENSLNTTAVDVFQASAARSDWYRACLALFERFDYLALPTAQVFPFDVDTHWPTEVAGRSMDTYHRWMEVVIPATMAGCPAVSVPVGFDPAGRPMGMQLIGRPRDDLSVLKLAAAYEAATDWVNTRLPAMS
ncbi:MAG: amidase [Burkholderiaceae bacterium]